MPLHFHFTSIPHLKDEMQSFVYFSEGRYKVPDSTNNDFTFENQLHFTYPPKDSERAKGSRFLHKNQVFYLTLVTSTACACTLQLRSPQLDRLEQMESHN